MKRLLLILMFACVVALPFAAQARVLSTGATTSLADAPVYESAALDRQFRVIGKIVVQASQVSGLRNEIARAAKRKGGDAVLKFKIVDYQGAEMGAVTTPKGQILYGLGNLSQASAEGVVVEFVKSDGIYEIDNATEVPILN